jgi:DNA-binding NarL/FixJ family response regulator
MKANPETTFRPTRSGGPRMGAARRSAILAAYAGHSRRFDEIASRRPGMDTPVAADVAAPEGIESLSDRQLEVLSLIAEGLSNNEICEQLEVALETVKTHVLHVLQRLNARSRAHAVSIGHRHGLLG